MPEAARLAVARLRDYAKKLPIGGSFDLRVRAAVNIEADALESFWRTHAAQVAFDLRTMTAKYDNERVLRERDASTHAAQPAKVRMTEELERVLATAVHGAAAYMNAKMYGHAEEARLAIAAVRAQAAEAGKVTP